MHFAGQSPKTLPFVVCYPAMPVSLNRFLRAQEKDYDAALGEIRWGRKRSHWIWYIFPQLKGLGYSRNAEYYGIANLAEATAYLRHPVLGARLIEISQALLELPGDDPEPVMGYPDDLKLKSSMTLFASVTGTNPVFRKVLNKFFGGSMDNRTLELLNDLLHQNG